MAEINPVELEQGSNAWHQARLGRVTASRVSDVIAKTKSGWGASRYTYMAELIAERLTGIPVDQYVNGAMQRGSEMEAEARAAYQFETTTIVAKVGFVPHPTIAMAGASPDGTIAEQGLVELKVPNLKTHIDTLLGQAVPAAYIAQMQFQMACTGRAWCDFCSYEPRLPESMRLFVKRVHRDAAFIAELEADVIAFLAELEDKLRKLVTLYEPKRIAA